MFVFLIPKRLQVFAAGVASVREAIATPFAASGHLKM